MARCPKCSKENREGARFCDSCGAALVEPPAAPALEERKVVSVLFCDLVGFTARSESDDPEDVRARIRPYHARLRQEIERYGGTVEKFIGDAVMAVFGAPVAHEDDAERAVRAGLRILEAIQELNETDASPDLQVRVGINTGEAVVALEARPEQGEGIVTGDVVNTASRLQGAAPVSGIAVSEHTHRSTERVFDYEQLEPVAVKGKAAPLELFRPLRPRGRFGSDVTRTHTTPLVGRELEKQLLIGTFERAAEQRSCQLVTIAGEPGVGKSRLSSELFRYIEERPGPVTWRQGRCLPYGEGIAFWALGEVVKAQCGILESDSPEVAAEKLDDALSPDDPDRAWLKARLSPLVGAGGEPAEQQESFTAWRRFLEWIASQRPAVLVFEDLHWADEALLAFVEHVADWSQGVPLLLLCTTRPELFEWHLHFGADARNAHRINLAPLSDDETAHLLSILLERSVLPAETQQMLLERAGGNPLYAEEFARLLADRNLLSGPLSDFPLPDSVQALIAARLDTLSPDRKSLLQDAAVVGKVFWAGALADMGNRDLPGVKNALHELARKELVRPARTSAMQGEAEYGFWHAIVRDVCYAQIPRAARAERHRAAAAWIESKAGERVEDLADVLAYHYLQALELVRAAGQMAEVEELETAARRYLALAGERALALDVASAEASLSRALAFAPSGHPERASLLERWAQAAQQQGRLEEAKAALEEAIALYKEQDEPIAAGRGLSTLVTVLWALGDPRRKEAIAQALAVLEAEAPGPELVAAYAQLAGVQLVSSALPESIAAAERAVELASSLGLPDPPRALCFGGFARGHIGDRRGLDDMRRALALSLDQGESEDAPIIYGNLGILIWSYDGPRAASEQLEEAVAFCERRGLARNRLFNTAINLAALAARGRPEPGLAEADALAKQAEAIGFVPLLVEIRSLELRLLAQRGEGATATDTAREVAALARETGVPALIATGLAGAVQLLLAARQVDEAEALLRELTDGPALQDIPEFAALVRCALALSEPDLGVRITNALEPHTPLQEHSLVACRAHLAEHAGDLAEAAALYAEAAERWRAFGDVPERAYALLGHGRCLMTLGKPDAKEPLRQARDLFASMGYKPALAETEALLGQAEAAAV